MTSEILILSDRQRIGTYRCQNSDEVSLRSFKIQGTVNSNLALMRQVNAEITVSIGRCYSISTDSVIVANASSVTRSDRVFHDAVHTGIRVHGHHVFEDGRTNWR